MTSGPGGTECNYGRYGRLAGQHPDVYYFRAGQTRNDFVVCSNLKLRQLGDQEFDIIHSVSNMTKYAVMVTEPNDIAYHLEKAWYLANHGRKGPVWLDIPLDVQGAVVDPEKLRHFDPLAEQAEPEVPVISEETAQEILAKIKQAKSTADFLQVRVFDSQIQMICC